MRGRMLALRRRIAPPVQPDPRKVLFALFMAVVFAAALLGADIAGPFATARATVPGTDSTDLNWDTNNRAYYCNYNTPIFTTTDTSGKTSLAYCVDPTTTVPAASTYATIPVAEFNAAWASKIRAAMWFGYGGPGFDASMWPSTWYDGSAMNETSYYIATHLILTYATTQRLGYVYYNTNSDFVTYSSQTYLGYDLRGKHVNRQSTMDQMFARASEVPDDYVCYFLACGQWDYTQYVIGQDHYEFPPAPQYGGLAVAKSSSNAAVTDGNACYNLSGAQFDVYSDAYLTQLAASITLGSDGYGSVDGLLAGTYWVLETVAPQGYVLDQTVHQVDVPADETVTVTCSDVPQGSPPTTVVQKTNAETNGLPTDGTSLAGARFAVDFYAGWYEEGSLPATPDRSWVLETDEQGRAILDDASFVSGDELYRDGQGRAFLPLGTVGVREIQAPEGYDLSDTSTHVAQVTSIGSGVAGANYIATVIADYPKRGGISVQKVDAETGEAAPQGTASMDGAHFAVITMSDRSITLDDTVYEKGSTVITLITNDRGFASTKADTLPCGPYRVVEVKAPTGYLATENGWDVQVSAGIITPVGFTVAQSPAAASLDDADAAPQDENALPQPLTALTSLLSPSVAQADEAPRAVVNEQVIRGGVRARKVDAETGGAQGDATLEGTEFSITSLNNNAVLVNGTTYAYGEVVMKMHTNDLGVAQTGDHDLPFGLYSVQETEAPSGYLRSGQAVRIEQDGVIVDVDEEFENEVIRGGIYIRKVDADTGEPTAQGAATLAGTQFAISNASEQAVLVGETLYEPDEVVMTVTTGEDGVARTGSSALPYGMYGVTEVAAPNGYLAGDGSVQYVNVIDNDVMHVLEFPFANAVIRGGISLEKHDADTEAAQPQGAGSLAGARYTVTNANEAPVIVGGQSFNPGEAVMELVTDQDGRASTGERDLPFGAYTLTEVAPPDGYLPSGQTQTVTVREDGVIVAADTPFDESVQRGGFGLRKLDAETGQAHPQGSASLAGARYDVANANENSVVVNGAEFAPGETVATLVTNEDGWAQTGDHDLPFGTYTVTEVAPPDGYRLGTAAEDGSQTGAGISLTVNVEGEGWWHSYETELSDQVIRDGLGIRKADADLDTQAQGAATLEGAVFDVANASAHPVVVGGTSFAPGEVVLQLVTDASGQAATGTRDLPFGTYTVTEVAAPAGYLPDSTPQSVAVAEEGVVALADKAFVDQPIRGGVSVQKADAEIGLAGPQGQGTYAGAVFEVVNANASPVVVGGRTYQPGEAVTCIVTDQDGKASTPERTLPFGTYRVRETQAPTGYLVNETIWEAQIRTDGQVIAVGDKTVAVTPAATSEEAGETGGLPNPFEALASLFSPATAQASEAGEAPAEKPDDDNVGESPELLVIHEQVIKGGIIVRKLDAETGTSIPQGGARLSGARFSITSLNKRPVIVAGTSYKEGDVVAVIETDEQGVAMTEPRTLPFGNYLVTEVAAPYGYLLDDPAPVQTVSISADNDVIELAFPFEDAPVRGGVSLQKVDADTGGGQALADASLAGARFTIANANENAVTVDGQSFAPGETVATLMTDTAGRASTGTHDLPFGRYTVTEQAAPEGYVLNTDFPQDVLVEEDGVSVACAVPFPNRVARSDVAGTKVEDGTSTPLANVAFLVTSLSTGERHVLVADDAGRFSTASDAAAHTQGTNANDAALDAQGRVQDEGLLSSANGVWFSGTAGATTEANDDLGALPFDRYRFDELRTSANYGHELVSFEVAVREDRAFVELGEIGDRVIELHTSARLEATGTDEGPALPDARILDTVAYGNLTPGATYELRAWLLDRTDGHYLAGSDDEPAGTLSFTPNEASGNIEVSLGCDASLLGGTRAVAVERLYLDGVEVASHVDRADNEQTVSFVGLQTTACGEVSQTHEEQVGRAVTITDTVSFAGLTPGRTYEVSGVLMDHATGEPVLDNLGKAVEACTSFEATTADGAVELAFTFDASSLAGTTVVAFETLSRDGVELAVHADLDDAGQSVSLIDIATTARDGVTGTQTGLSDANSLLIDTVSYRGLIPGQTYVLEGLILNAASGLPLVDCDGKASASSVSFVPDQPDGSIEIPFALDTSNLAGGSTVVFESLTHDGKLVASHAELGSEEQTVRWQAPQVPKTGDRGTFPHLTQAALIGAGLAAAGAFPLVARLRRQVRVG